MPCALEDPALREEFRDFGRRRREAFVKHVRAAVARPLELIDYFVERFRGR